MVESELYYKKKYEELLLEMKEEFPYFHVVIKKYSKFNQFLKKLTVWNSEMNETYTTTLSSTIAVNNTWEKKTYKARYTIMVHERIHMRQMQKYGLTTFFLVFGLVPFPVKFAYYRKKWEQEAYIVGIYMKYKEGGRKLIFGKEYLDYLYKQFVGPFYLFMWYSWKDIMKWIVKTVKDIEENKLTWNQLKNFRRLPKNAKPLRAPKLLRWLYPDDFL